MTAAATCIVIVLAPRGPWPRSVCHAAAGSALDDLAQIHALVHGQGGHLQVRQGEPAGTSLHVYLRAATPEQIEDRAARARSTVTRFPFIRLREPRDTN